ncbi:MAG: PEP-utilizing enzyme [Pseudomonadota bacterium]
MFRRQQFDADYPRIIHEFETWVSQPVEPSRSLSDYFTEALTRMGKAILESSYPAFMSAYFAGERIKKLADKKSPEQLDWVDAICGGHEEDMIVNMGLMLYDLAMLLPVEAFEDIEALTAQLQQRELPEDFLNKWDEFIARYGCRGPLEMELANPKYGEAPQLALQQMASITNAGTTFNPHDMRATQVAQREQAFEKLLSVLSPRKAKRLQKDYATYLRYIATRELFKHHILQVYAQLRRMLLHRADTFIQAGRLDQREQIFELTMADVETAVQDADFDLRATAKQRSAFAHKLKSHVRHFPLFIDSRGRILRAPPKYEAGALVGVVVSSGVARGPVKVMHDPFEKEIQPGDVLVAVTTDPGWTPLFIPAAAVILEIGGELQHGALVAREYGKPCVSSIQDVTNQFKDGQIVEVDGDAGVIRFIEED